MPSSRLLSYPPMADQAPRLFNRGALKSSLLGMPSLECGSWNMVVGTIGISSSRGIRVPKVSGKTCVENVGGLRTNWGQKMWVFHIHISSPKSLWINIPLNRILYTFCMRFIHNLTGYFTPVNSGFYTVYTPPTITTTTLNIYKRGIL